MDKDSESVSMRLRSSWDANADLWTNAVRSASIPSRTAGTDQAVIDAVTESKPASLIDIGCGEGWLVRRIQNELGCGAVGIDASPSLIERARQADPAGRYTVLPYKQLAELPADMLGPFDTAVCNFSLFDEDLRATLCGIRRLLSDSGQLIIQTPHPWAGASDQAYQDGWMEETFCGLSSSSSAWQAMPWYFRTLGSWVQQINIAGMALHTIHEPLDQSVSRPLSMVLVCQKLANSGNR